MKYDPSKHHRRSTRLQGYDYSQAGAYVITVVTQDRAHLFGEVVGDEMVLNEYGQIVLDEWQASAGIRKEIELDAFVVMPNHMHGIVVIVDDVVGASGGRPDVVTQHGRPPANGRPPVAPTANGPKPKSLGAMVAGYKSAVTRRINALREMKDAPVWQRNYHDRIIRNERELNAFRKYIEENPLQWALDQENK